MRCQVHCPGGKTGAGIGVIAGVLVLGEIIAHGKAISGVANDLMMAVLVTGGITLTLILGFIVHACISIGIKNHRMQVEMLNQRQAIPFVKRRQITAPVEYEITRLGTETVPEKVPHSQ